MGEERAGSRSADAFPFHRVTTKRGIDMQTIPNGSSVLCPILVYFNWNGVDYRVGINLSSQHIAEGWSPGEDARVTCTAGVTSGGVNDCSA